MKDPRGELRGSARLLRNQEQPRPSTHYNRTTSSMSESACYTLQIDIEHRFLRQTWYEPVTAGALVTLWSALAADPRGLAEFDTLVDLRAATVALTTSDVVMLASVAKRQPPSQRAIVTANDADFDVMCMLELKAGGGLRGYGVFRTIDEACVWLGNAACA